LKYRKHHKCTNRDRHNSKACNNGMILILQKVMKSVQELDINETVAIPQLRHLSVGQQL